MCLNGSVQNPVLIACQFEVLDPAGDVAAGDYMYRSQLSIALPRVCFDYTLAFTLFRIYSMLTQK